ncbi:MAG TPA: glycosyltransferase family 39 protein [Candidatus Binatia bacterium]|nr:glycosyltransferase family 39 protein [Candidatus Binatia bacterium]
MRLHPLWTGFGLGLLCALLYLWGLGDLPFHTKGEPREATVVWEIYASGEWVLPLRNGSLIPSKPPLFHWLSALLSLSRGELNEFTIRLPSALLAIVGVLLTYSAGVTLWGVEAGLFAALILATSFEWVRAAITARVDMTLTVFMVMAFLFFLFLYRRHQISRVEALFFFFLLGLATLAKGPVGALLPGLAVGVFLLRQRDLQFLWQLHLVSGIVLFVLVAGSWYGLALWKGGEEFFVKQVLQENLFRFFASGETGMGHEHPFYYFAPNLFLGMAPWSFFFPPLAVFLYQRRRTWTEDGFRYLLVWAATVFLFYSAASSKRSVYILPLYPAVALLLGVWWQELRQGTVALPRIVLVLLRGSGYVCFGMFLLAIAAVLAQFSGHDPLAVIRPLLHPKDQSSLPIFTGIVAAYPCAFLLWFAVVGPSALILVRGVRRQYWGEVFASLVAFTISTFLLVNNIFQPALGAARTFRPFMSEVVAHVGNAPLFFYRAFDSGALYYADRRIPFYDPSARPPDSPCFLLTWEEEWAKLARQEGTALQVVAISEGTGPKGNHRLVLVYVPPGTIPPAENAIPADYDAPEEDTL